MPSIKSIDKNKIFPHGNFSDYYQYRIKKKKKNINENNSNDDEDDDIRLISICDVMGGDYFFKNKSVLDIGCNDGHVSILVARKYNAKKVIGIDIEDRLIEKAKNKIKNYKRQGLVLSSSSFDGDDGAAIENLRSSSHHHSGRVSIKDRFPFNIEFITGNIIAEAYNNNNDDDADRVSSSLPWSSWQPQRGPFDIILCLSVTKWIHLHTGDDGIKELFKKIIDDDFLSPSGYLILEPQSWLSYRKVKNLIPGFSEMIKTRIKLKPEMFKDYFLDEYNEVLEFVAEIGPHKSDESDRKNSEEADNRSMSSSQMKKRHWKDHEFDRPIIIFRKKKKLHDRLEKT
jgi:7SK snRNA methylphosphate capping enzyme